METRGRYTSAELVRRILEGINGFADPSIVIVAKKDRNLRVGEFLAREFGLVDELNSPYFAFSKLIALIERAIQDVEELELEDTYRLDIVSDLKELLAKAISLGPSTEISGWMGNIGANYIRSLKFAEVALRDSNSFVSFEEEAESLGNAVRELMDKFSDCDLPAAFKVKAFSRLNELSVALANIRVWGTDGVDDAVKLLAGEMLVGPMLDPNVSSTSTWGALKKIVAEGIGILTLINGGTDQIGQSAETIQKISSSIFGDGQ